LSVTHSSVEVVFTSPDSYVLFPIRPRLLVLAFHTTIFPDGSSRTYIWTSQHSPYSWLLRPAQHGRHSCQNFRQGFTKGVKASKGRKAESFNRAKKTREYRNNAKTPCRWPWGGKAKTFAKKYQNRQDRRRTKLALAAEQYESLGWKEAPRDTWRWD